MSKIFLFILLYGLIVGLIVYNSLYREYEYPLKRLISDEVGYEVKVGFEVITQKGSASVIFVSLNGIDVRLRDDNKNYTSIKITRYYGEDRYFRGTILVPYQEDVEKWNEHLKKLKLTPERVLPPNSEKD